MTLGIPPQGPQLWSSLRSLPCPIELSLGVSGTPKECTSNRSSCCWPRPLLPADFAELCIVTNPPGPEAEEGQPCSDSLLCAQQQMR